MSIDPETCLPLKVSIPCDGWEMEQWFPLSVLICRGSDWCLILKQTCGSKKEPANSYKNLSSSITPEPHTIDSNMKHAHIILLHSAHPISVSLGDCNLYSLFFWVCYHFSWDSEECGYIVFLPQNAAMSKYEITMIFYSCFPRSTFPTHFRSYFKFLL